MNQTQIQKSENLLLLITIICITMFGGCRGKGNNVNDFPSESQDMAFFGDSTCTIISSNRPNGYLVKIFISKDLTLLNLSRGDSINQYVPLSINASDLRFYIEPTDSDLNPYHPVVDKFGTYIREINIPIEKEQLGHGLFFMDVNFDGEEELVIEHPGFNRQYYACFDIVNGIANTTPGILAPMSEAPYNNIVSTNLPEEMVGGIYTEFDYDKKTIHIVEQIGCCAHIETWCEYISDSEWDKPSVVVIKEEHVESNMDGQKTEVYTRQNGKLELTNTIMKKWDE